jgi:putative transposase
MKEKILTRGYKYQIHPTPQQAKHLDKVMRDCRSLHNRVLRMMKAARSTEKPWTEEFKLEDILRYGESLKHGIFKGSVAPKRVLTNAIEILYRQHKTVDILKQNELKFKRLDGFHSAHYPRELVSIKNGLLQIADLDEGVVISISRPMPSHDFTKVVISRSVEGCYYASFNVRVKAHGEHGDEVVGIDLGVVDLAVTSYGEKFKTTPSSFDVLMRLNRFYALLKEYVPRSYSWRKISAKLTRFKRKVVNKRNTYFYQIAAAVVKKASAIALEDLNIAKMVLTSKYSQGITQSAWGGFQRVLVEVAQKACIPVGFVGRYFPSTRLASCCGYLHPHAIPTHLREWECPECGVMLDRDVNAAINLERRLVACLKKHDVEGFKILRLD